VLGGHVSPENAHDAAQEGITGGFDFGGGMHAGRHCQPRPAQSCGISVGVTKIRELAGGQSGRDRITKQELEALLARARTVFERHLFEGEALRDDVAREQLTDTQYPEGQCVRADQGFIKASAGDHATHRNRIRKNKAMNIATTAAPSSRPR
jgi:hypothetical protein